jgi:hypothetical protein
MRHHGPSHNHRVVVFEGTAREPIPHLQEPIVCKSQPLFPVNCDVEQVLHGEWTDKQMVVHFGTCSNLPDPDAGGTTHDCFCLCLPVVLAGLCYLNLLLTPEQKAHVKGALGLH